MKFRDEKDRQIRSLEKELEYWKDRHAKYVDAMELQYKKLTFMYNHLRREMDGDKAERGLLSIFCKNCGRATSGWCNECGISTLS